MNSIIATNGNAERSHHRTSTWLRVSAVGAVAAMGLAACSSSNSGTPASSGAQSGGATLTIGVLAPFTGADAALGPNYRVGCLAAANAINTAGGILGHQVACQVFDTRGDPADAVPATRQMFASTPNLALVIGLTGDEAASVVPIINAAKMSMFGMTGQAEFSSTKFDYFYRLVAPDLAESYAMVAIAAQKGYKNIALAYGNDIGSQTFVQPAIDSIKKAGLNLASNQTLDLHATTFRTEASKIVASHPDVIFTEALGATDATFLSEIKQLNGGKMIPVIGTQATIDPAWFKAVAAAVGADTLATNYVADNVAVDTSGTAYQSFLANLTAVNSQVPGGTANYQSVGGTIHLYDGIMLAALAMNMSNSVTPGTYNADILPIGNGTSGATTVTNYADGVKAIQAKTAIRYQGPGGPTNFDAFHTSANIFVLNTYDAKGNVNVAGTLSAADLQAVTP
jgi:ABC-type branched-subunit amino acid transport system substrate-binding protein